MRNEILLVASGALVGALGTAVIGKELALAQRLPERLRPAAPNQDPGRFIVDKMAEQSQRPVPEKTRKVAARSLHLAYGMGFGALLGLLRAGRRGRLGIGGALASGAALGAVVWAAGYLGWLPALGLVRPVREQGLHTVSSLAAHLGYGVATALPLVPAEGLLKR
jgi:hypothetical protein